jgi:hypothetical protein
MIRPATIRAICSAVDAAAFSDAFLVRLPSETTRETARPRRPFGSAAGVASSVFTPPDAMPTASTRSRI